MLVKPSDFIVDMKGSILGTTYQRNRYGLIRRAKPNPTNPQTTRQQERRSLFGALSAGWRTLTDAQRDGWRALAETTDLIPIFGDPKPQTGNTLYVALNSNLQLIGEATIDDAPGAYPVGIIVSADITVLDVSDQNFEIDVEYTGGHSVPASNKLIIYATPGLSAGINSPGQSKYRVIKHVAAATDTSALDIAANYMDVFAFPSAGQRVFIRVACISTVSGVAFTPFGADAIAVA